jgi:glycosyl transferase family 25
MQIPVYIINLKRSVERRDHTIKHLNDLGVHFQIIDAVDGSEFSDKEILNNQVIGLWKDRSRTRYMRRGEIGCVLSHLKIYQKMIDEDIKVACILEDDIECSKEFKDFLICGNLNIVDWDLLYLGHHSQYSKKEACSIERKKTKIGNYRTGKPIELPGGSYGYIIKKEAARIILKHAYPIRMSLDHYIGNSPALGIRIYLLSPPCVDHNHLYNSTIAQNLNIEYTNSFIESIRRQFRKTYKWLPVLQRLRILINANLNQSLVILRKTGLIRKSYAKFN